MAFSYGFYNSVKGDRKYDATPFAKIFDGVINDGVFQSVGNQFFVEPSANGLAVIVKTGRAWLNHTWNLNDSDMLIPLQEADLLLNRIDTVILDINNYEDSRVNQLTVLTGVGSEEPVATQLIWEEKHKQYAIAEIYIPAEAAEVTQDNITWKVGQSPLPWVTAILETTDTTYMLAQWEAQWNKWLNDKTTDHDNWETEHQLEFTTWIELHQDEFIDWFNEMKDQLSEDAAGNLQNQITDITEEEFNRYYSMVNKTTVINKKTNGDVENIVETEVLNEINSRVATTTFSTDTSGNRLIVTQLDDPESGYLYTKTVKISSNSTGGKDITESYNKTLVGGETL